MSKRDRAAAVASLSPKQKLLLLNGMPASEREGLLASLSPTEKAGIYLVMTPKEAAAWLGGFPASEKAEILARLSPDEHRRATYFTSIIIFIT